MSVGSSLSAARSSRRVESPSALTAGWTSFLKPGPAKHGPIQISIAHLKSTSDKVFFLFEKNKNEYNLHIIHDGRLTLIRGCSFNGKTVFSLE